jgi:AAA+ ATPase superfamily predicted ATPase
MSEALNPFLINGYLSPEYFCDREKESASIISALKNGRNLTLMSPRRMGKTGLIKHVFHQLEQVDKGIVCFYIDIYSTKNLNDFVNVLSKHIIGKLDSSLTKMGKSITQFIKNSHLVLSYDPITGAPQTSITVQP